MKLLNNISNLPNVIKNAFYNRFAFLRKKVVKPDTDLKLLHQIQPISGVKFEDTFWKLGDGYMTCLHLHSLPESISRYWLSYLFEFPNVITTVDIRTMKISDTKDSIERVINDNLSTIETTESVIEAKDAKATYDKMIELLDEISELGRVVLAVDLRLYITGQSFYEIEQNIESVQDRLKEMGYARFGKNLSEQKEEYINLFNSPNKIRQTLSARNGFPLPSNVVAQGLPFNYVGWEDPCGYYLGDTYNFSPEEGTLIFNPYYKDGFRSSYDMFICGVKGSGKSTIIKYLVEQEISTGNKIRIIDVTGEFGNVVKNLRGAVIKFDAEGNNCILNFLEILRITTNDTTNYLMHITKLSDAYKLLKPDYTEEELKVFTSILKKLYVKFGIIESENTNKYENITGLPSERYPIFSDLVDLLEEEINKLSENKSEENRYTAKLLIRAKITIKSLVKNYGPLFDAHTNIPNVMNADIISYDISDLVSLEDGILDMMLNSALSMAYDSCMDVGVEMKRLYDNHQIDYEDVVHHTIILDECHMTINVRKPFAINRMRAIMKQDRKYFIGVYLATQNIADMCRDGNSNANTDMKTLFEECQYKMIFRQDPGAITYVKTAFNSILTSQQIEEIPLFANREAYMVLNPTQTIRFHTKQMDATKLAYYGGGA